MGSGLPAGFISYEKLKDEGRGDAVFPRMLLQFFDEIV